MASRRTIMNRREFLRLAGAVGGVAALGACVAPTPQVVKETVVVQETVPVEKVVKETVVTEKKVETVVTATPEPKGAVEQLQGTLTIAKYVDAPNKDGSQSTGQLVWEKITAAYQKAQPNVKLSVTTFPEGASPDEVYQWIQTRQASRKVPTLVNSTADNVTAPQENTGTAPWVAIDSYLAEVNPYTGNIWKDDQDYPLIRWRSAMSGRKYIYGMTPTKYKAAWMYNKSIFEKVGVKEPTTWSEWFAVNDKIKAAGFTPMSVFGAAFIWSHLTWILFGALGAKSWQELAGPGQDFPTYERKLEWAICGKWKQDVPWVREGYAAMKKLASYCPEGFMGMNPTQTTEMFMQGKSAMQYADQGQLRVIDAARKDGTIDFDVDAFPTPAPDGGVFSKEVMDGVGPIADDGENYGAWVASAANVREDKSENAVKMAVDFMRFLTTPEIQNIYVEDLLNLPVNPNVKPKDPRIASWMKNPNQIQYKFYFFGDRPTWYQYFQAYLSGQQTIDEFVKSSEAEIKKQAETDAKEGKVNIVCT